MVAHRDKQVVLVQHFVVLEVVQHGIGNGAGFGRQEHRRAFHACWRTDKYRFQETGQVDRIGAQFLVHQAPAVFPGHHQRKDGAADQQREPAAVKQLEQIRGPERKVNDEEKAGGRDAHGERKVPAVADDEESQDGGDQHVGAHRYAVGAGQIARRLEHHDRQHNGDKKPPVDKGQVDLPGVLDTGVLHLQARQVAELDHLLGDGKCARDQGLRCDHCGHGGQPHQGHQRPVGRHHEKRVLHRRRVAQQQGALPEVIERERRHDDGKPGDTNRLLAEMPHVGIQRLTPCDAQDHGAENDEGDVRVGPDETNRVMRT